MIVKTPAVHKIDREYSTSLVSNSLYRLLHTSWLMGKLKENRRTKNGGGLGTRLSERHMTSTSQAVRIQLTMVQLGPLCPTPPHPGHLGHFVQPLTLATFMPAQQLVVGSHPHSYTWTWTVVPRTILMNVFISSIMVGPSKQAYTHVCVMQSR